MIDCGKERTTLIEPQTLHEYLDASGVEWSEAEVVASISALRGSLHSRGTVDLPAGERRLWDEFAGIRRSPELTDAADRRNLVAAADESMSARTGEEVADRLRVKPSTIRHYRLNRRLYAYVVDGKLRFPEWQFTPQGDAPLPGLAHVLSALDAELHPQSVAGFFRTAQDDLEVDGRPASPREWLLGNGDAERVAQLAADLNLGL